MSGQLEQRILHHVGCPGRAPCECLPLKTSDIVFPPSNMVRPPTKFDVDSGVSPHLTTSTNVTEDAFDPAERARLAPPKKEG